MKILVSSCLLGYEVRYDGKSCGSHNHFLKVLNEQRKIIHFCPEVFAGFGVPREPIELMQERLVRIDGTDVTERFSTSVFPETDKILSSNCIVLAITKEHSPSCGVHEIYDGSFSGVVIKGSGLWKQYLERKGVKVFSENELDSARSYWENCQKKWPRS